MKKLKRNFKWLLTVVAVLTLAGAVEGLAAEQQASTPPGLSMSPLSQEFIDWQKKVEASGLDTYDEEGHGLGHIPSPFDRSHLRSQKVGVSEGEGAPVSYDLRTLGHMTPVKDQGACGSCWAFATYGSLESWLLKILAETWDFSENHLKNYHGFDWTPCAGGNADISTAYLVRWDGPVSESDDSYNPWDDRPSPGGPCQKYVESVFWFFSDIDMKNELMASGAMYVSFYWDAAYYNTSTYTYYYPGGNIANHAVTLAGWDDNKVVPGAPGNGAWLLKNSWGTGLWGGLPNDNGYFWLSYYDTYAQDYAVSFRDAVPPSSYLTNYQYDPLGRIGGFGYGTTTAWGANVFTPTVSEDLVAVGFYALVPNTAYNIYVYDNFNGTSFSVLLGSTSGTAIEEGYHTITLPAPISLTNGDDFSIVIEFTTPGYTFPVPAEYVIVGYSSAASAGAGESYVSSTGASGTWTDLGASAYQANVCIKGWTSKEEAKWVQPPCLGDPDLCMDVDATDDDWWWWAPQALADDFNCTASGLITDIHIWGSWLYDEPPYYDPNHVWFTLCIYSNDPCGPMGWSEPNELLWTKEFHEGQFDVEIFAEGPEAYYIPCEPEYFPDSDWTCWLYSFYIDPNEAFVQEEGTIYWLALQAHIYDPDPFWPYRFGWKNSSEQWNDDAVWAVGDLPGDLGSWNELRHPLTEESVDLAFKIVTGEEPNVPEVKPPVEHLKWSQPPIEIDPTSAVPTYKGWDEPSYLLTAVTSCEQILYAPTAVDDPTFRDAVSLACGDATVDYFDAQAGTPSVALLLTYDCVFTWCDYAYADDVNFGNNLADYVDAGGKVILGQWCYDSGQLNSLAGRIMTSAYCPVTVSTGYSSGSYAGDGTDCVHNGVVAYDTQYLDVAALGAGNSSDGTFTPGGELSVAWRPDRRVYYSAGNTGTYYGTGDWPQLTCNECCCAAGGSSMTAAQVRQIRQEAMSVSVNIPAGVQKANSGDERPVTFKGHVLTIGAATAGTTVSEIRAAAMSASVSVPAGLQKTNDGGEALVSFRGHDLSTSNVGGGPCASILYAPSNIDQPAFRSALSTACGGATVDYYDASASTPSVALLSTYDCVWTRANSAYANKVAFGDNLADYVDAGGTVILGQFCYKSDQGNWLEGRIMTAAYCPVTVSTGYSSGSYAGDGTDCVHNGVTSYSTSLLDVATLQPGNYSDGTFSPGGSLAVAWRPDRKVYYSPGNRGGLDPGDWPQLICNACSCVEGAVGGKIVADDFRCLGNMPISSIHWWGSYVGWDRQEPPPDEPIAWRIGFWSNVPAGGQPGSAAANVGAGLQEVNLSNKAPLSGGAVSSAKPSRSLPVRRTVGKPSVLAIASSLSASSASSASSSAVGVEPLGGGDTCALATVIGTLPFSDTGNTCSFVDDYDEICPYAGSTSPDVAYSYTPASNIDIDISLCNSAYDTKVYVYDGGCPGTLVACNDDLCGFQSELPGVSLTGGNTYYIIVDGYGGDCGDYIIDVTEYVPCVVDCPPGATVEDEPDCGLPTDTVNGGCNSNPPVFSPISCGETVCGTAAWDGSTRDTDWYEVVTTKTTRFTWTVEAEFLVQAIIIDAGSGNCIDLTILDNQYADECVEISMTTAYLPAGTYWFFVAPDFSGPTFACGRKYVATLTCEVEPFSYPETLLWQIEVPADRVESQWVGYDQFPERPSDTCFQYYVQLDPEEWFWQSEFLDDTQDEIFWLSIAAVYPEDCDIDFMWGWKTRAWPWMDDAVTFDVHEDPVPGFTNTDPNLITPLEDALVCGEPNSYDVAFELNTDPNWIKWEQAFTGIRHWPHYEDELSMAIEDDLGEPNIIRLVADDWPCDENSPVTAAVWWGSYIDYRYQACECEQMPRPVKPDYFLLSIWTDVPAGGDASGDGVEAMSNAKIAQIRQQAMSASVSVPAGVQKTNMGEELPVIFTGHVLSTSEAPSGPCANILYCPSDGDDAAYRAAISAACGGCTVDYYDARAGTPSVALLSTYDCVYTWANAAYANNVAFGDNLADYVDAGGTVVLGVFCTFTQGNYLAGKIMTSAYCPVTSPTGGNHYSVSAYAGDGTTCIHNGVTFYDSWARDYLALQGSGIQDGSYLDGEIAQAYRPDFKVIYNNGHGSTVGMAIPGTGQWPDIVCNSCSCGLSFSHPNEIIWEYKAYDYDEVLVGYDKHPEDPTGDGREPVFRYSVRIPEEDWFCQEEPNNVYWFSVVAVYEDVPDYNWGWTNHKHVYNDDAVAGYLDASGEWTWEELYDQNGDSEDMSFVLFTHPNPYYNCPDYNNDGIVNFIDYAYFADDWRWSGPLGGYNNSDLNCDGLVDLYDLAIFVRHWLESCQPPCP